MPRQFTETLSAVTPANQNFTGNGVDTTIGDTFRTIGRLASGVVESRREQAAASQLASYAAEASDIVGQTSGYSQKFDEIQRAIATADPGDQATLERYRKEMDRLKKGELQGISPEIAAARINDLTRRTILRSPMLTAQILNLRNVISSNIKSVAGQHADAVDPELKAALDTNERAAKNGLLPADQRAIDNKAEVARLAELNLGIKTRMGIADYNAIEQALIATATAQYATQAKTIFELIKRPDFTPEKQELFLTDLSNQLRQQVEGHASQIRTQYNIDVPQARIDATIKAMTDPITNLANVVSKINNPKQRVDIANWAEDIFKHQSLDKIRKDLGAASILINTTQDILPVMDAISEAAALWSDQTGQDTLRKKARLGDYKSQIMLELLENGGAERLAADNYARAASGGDIDDTGLPELNQMTMRACLNRAVDPTIDPTERANVLMACTRNPDVFDAWESRADIRQISKTIPGVVQSLKNRTAEVFSEYASKVSVNGLESIQANWSNRLNPFTVRLSDMQNPMASRQDTLGGRILAGGIVAAGGGTGPIIPSNLRDTVELLNQEVRVMSEYMTPDEIEQHFTKMQEDAIAYAGARDNPERMRELQELDMADARGVDFDAEQDLQEQLSQEPSPPPVTDESVIDGIINREGRKPTVDSGGPTKFGITMPTLKAWRGGEVTKKDIDALTEDEARAIYKAEYIRPFKNIEDPDLHIAVVDTGVNHGVPTMKRWLSRIEGLEPLDAVRTLMDIRRNDYLRLATQNPKKYGGQLAGWLNRISRLERELVDRIKVRDKNEEQSPSRAPVTRVEPGVYEDSVTGRYIQIDETGKVIELFS